MVTGDREWKCFVSDMVEFCEKVIANSSNTKLSSFVADSNLYDATIWNIVKIGEAATKVPDEIRDSFPNIEWAKIIAMRNQLIHGYFQNRNEIVWETIRSDIPKLLVDLRELLKRSQRRRIGFNLPVADNQHVVDLLQLGISDLRVHAFARVVDLDS